MKNRDFMSTTMAWIFVIVMSLVEVFFGFITYMAYQESISTFGKVFFLLEGLILGGLSAWPLLIGLSVLIEPVREAFTNRPKYGKLPHFGEILNAGQVMDIIKNSHFSPYKTRDGEILKNVTISDDEKWVCILGGYFPLDLICGYNPEENDLYAIDGSAIPLPRKAKRAGIRRQLQSFWADRGIWYTDLPTYVAKSYRKARTPMISKLDQEDFGRMRYLFEKSMVNDKYGYWRVNKKLPKYHAVLPGGAIDRIFFDRVLSDSDIQQTAEAVRTYKVKISEYLNFADYKNEFSVCNGVELLKVLEYPKNVAGIDFLFECLGDVDEAYFRFAVEVLHKYPRQMVTGKIEEAVKLAFEKGDVVNLAGLMFLAKDFDYEIEYIKEIKNSELAKNAESKVDSTNSDKIPEFQFDELEAFGSEEVQEFDAGGTAYKKQA